MHSVLESDVLAFFSDFKVDSVLRDHTAWYVTFKTPDSARRAGMVLNSGGRTIAHHSVTVSTCPPPSKDAVAMAAQSEPAAGAKKTWTREEMVQSAEHAILSELKVLLEKDITERVVAAGLRKLVAEEKAKVLADSKGKEGAGAGLDGEGKSMEKRGWKGLSFRKPGKRAREEEVKSVVVAVVEEVQVDEVPEPEPEPEPELELEPEPEPEPEPELEPEPEPLVSPPRKKRKKEVLPKEQSADVLSEVEAGVVGLDVRKRILSEDVEVEEPVKKRTKKDVVEEEVPIKKAPSKKKPLKKKLVKDLVEQVILSETLAFVPPTTTTIDVSKLEPISRSPSPVPQVSPPPIRPPDPLEEGVCEDDEDLYFSRLVLSGETEPPRAPSPPPDAVPPFRKHLTGSARTEGYYKISHAEKSAYVAQYTLRSTNVENAVPTEQPPSQHITSSRSNRANARRRAQGLEEINQVQRAVALSKGETGAAELSIKFNQLQTRKKHLRFARSPIHDWGLYAMERIARGEMVIEYVGEIIHAQVSDKREKVYERQGIGSSYLFRIDEDLVVDATKKGNLGRLINHSCDPNCTAKIITISGEKKIVIYAKQDIELGDGITNDYHFPIEQDKIPCLWDSAKCRGDLDWTYPKLSLFAFLLSWSGPLRCLHTSLGLFPFLIHHLSLPSLVIMKCYHCDYCMVFLFFSFLFSFKALFSTFFFASGSTWHVVLQSPDF
ncbi:SET-domain-containing protein [Imleria badia]|nr:SET-domain-containing protein [Imleria badia]